MFTTEEKDQMMLDAAEAYQRMYGKPQTDGERFYVQKGMEAYSAVVHERIQEKT